MPIKKVKTSARPISAAELRSIRRAEPGVFASSSASRRTHFLAAIHPQSRALGHSRRPLVKKDCRLLLHNIRSTHNVGAIFRTADAAGVSKIYLTGYTPTPTDQFKRPIQSIAKTALGAEIFLPWEYLKTPLQLIRTLKKEKFTIVALEQSPRSQDYKKIRLSGKALVVVGNEIKGLSVKILKEANVIAEISMRGKKESLNVSVALGIALFRMLDI